MGEVSPRMKSDESMTGPLVSAAVLCALILPAPARAASFFHGEPRPVRACVLLLPSTVPAAPAFGPDGQNINPYVFYAMDQRTDLRPQSWEFVNPMAPPAVTEEMRQRWLRLVPNDPTPLTTG